MAEAAAFHDGRIPASISLNGAVLGMTESEGGRWEEEEVGKQVQMVLLLDSYK